MGGIDILETKLFTANQFFLCEIFPQLWVKCSVLKLIMLSDTHYFECKPFVQEKH